jgi:hypothetical protein
MDLFLLLKDVAECQTVWNELLQAPVLLLRMGARLSVSGTLVQRQVATMWSSYLHGHAASRRDAGVDTRAMSCRSLCLSGL